MWAIFRTLAEERRRRQIDPTLPMLREVQPETPSDSDDKHAHPRVREMYEPILLVTGWFGDMQKLDVATLEKLMRLGARVTKLLEVKDKLSGALGGNPAEGKRKSARTKKE